jgi:hypothetical protein
LLFECAWATVSTFSQNDKHLKGRPGAVSVLHTHSRRLDYLHGQRSGTYGIFYEYPHPVPGILESEENLPLPKVLASLALHFDA